MKKFVTSKAVRVSALILADIIFINLAYFWGFLVRFGNKIPREYVDSYLNSALFITLIYIISMSAFKMYKSLWSNASIDECVKGIFACVIAGFITLVLNMVGIIKLPNSIVILSVVLFYVMTIGLRISYRVYRRVVMFDIMKKNDYRKRVIVIGAGECGHVAISEMFRNRKLQMNPIGIIDDDRNKVGTYLLGVKILGTRDDIQKICAAEEVEEILIAIANITPQQKKELLEICQETTAKIKIIPGIYEIINNKISFDKIRSVEIKDLLGREEIKLDKQRVSNYIEGKTVLVTGGGGSIGSELCRQISKFDPKKLLILDIYENNAYDIQNELKFELPDLDLETIIASVRDKKRLQRIFNQYKPDIVFHAAAHKHVPLMESNSEEAIKNNVVGTLNVAECSDEYEVEKFVMISTDKAVNPTNIMGATKRICEMIVQAMNKKSKTDFVAVRFGNVLGSNGSVIPLFTRQIKNGGPVTITHKDIIRYFMLIPEAAQLVLQAVTYAKGGEIFVLDMGEPVKIYDLAVNLIKLSGLEPGVDIKIKEIGLRPGEKLYEELLMNEEGLIDTEDKKIFIGKTSNFEIETLKEQIKQLNEIAVTENKQSLKRKIKEIVPTFVEPDEVNKKFKK